MSQEEDLTSDETLLRLLEDFFRSDEYRLKVSEVGTAYPDKKSIEIDFDDLDNYYKDLGSYLLLHPTKTIRFAEESLKSILPPDINHPLHVRFFNLPTICKISANGIRDIHRGALSSITGILRKATNVGSRIIEGHFSCAKCGFENVIAQDDDIVREPFECEGCQRSANQTSFHLMDDFCVRVDSQELEIQELPEHMPGGIIPESLLVYAEDDLAGVLQAGNRCTITGIISIKKKYRGRARASKEQFVFHSTHIEKLESDYKSIEISEEEEQRIRMFSRNPDLFPKLVRSIAPGIYGEDIVKEALILQQFGGIRIIRAEGAHVRGDIHILFVGDPGTAKTQLLHIMSLIAPRGLRASGRAATAAGLTAAAIQNEGNRWVFEAGAMVLADCGHLCIDELDKMKKGDSSAMHPGMEQQVITLNKAGLTVTLHTRCSILAAANPEHGYFDVDEPLLSQVKLPSSLLSRFDLIFPFIDSPKDESKNEGIARTILSKFFGKEEVDLIDHEFLRKYISYARTIEPAMTQEPDKILYEFWMGERKKSRPGAPTINARHLEGLSRLSFASARVRLSEKVTVQDAERAIRIYCRSIGSIAFDGEGINVNMVETSDIKKPIFEELEGYLRKNAPVDPKKLNRAMKRKGFGKDFVKKALDRLIDDGRVYLQEGKYYVV